jgi:hypothetical protein
MNDVITGRRKRCCSKQKASSTVVPKGYYQDTKMQIAKDASKRVGQEERRGRAELLVESFMAHDAHDQAEANVAGKTVSQGGRQ